MPTVLRIGGYRFHFFSNEGSEPPHIHVKADEKQAKFCLDPVSLAANYRFNAPELTQLRKLIEDHQTVFLEAWNEHLE